jgi:uncharacterized SAM-dependent methyltransferase
LVSSRDQEVSIAETGERIGFKQGESMHTEISQKYDTEGIYEMAEASGYEVILNFFDSRHYFVSSLWRVARHTG